MKYKIPFLTTLGVLLLIIGACVITGCSSGSGDSGSKIQSNTQPVVINSNKPTNDSGLPPDPGKAGKATLAGIDSDHDGVRDDVQRYIALTYPKSEKTRKALTQYTKAITQALVDAKNKEKSIKHSEESDRSMECLWYIYGSVDAYGKVEDKLLSVILNTDKRNYAYFTYDNQLGGEVFSSVPYDERASSCNFDVSSLPN